VAARRLRAVRDPAALAAVARWLDDPRVPYGWEAAAAVLEAQPEATLAPLRQRVLEAGAPAARVWALASAARRGVSLDPAWVARCASHEAAAVRAATAAHLRAAGDFDGLGRLVGDGEAGGSVLALFGPMSAINAGLQSLRYTPVASMIGATELSISIESADLNGDRSLRVLRSVAIMVTAVGGAPEFAAPPAGPRGADGAAPGASGRAGEGADTGVSSRTAGSADAAAGPLGQRLRVLATSLVAETVVPVAPSGEALALGSPAARGPMSSGPCCPPSTSPHRPPNCSSWPTTWPGRASIRRPSESAGESPAAIPPTARPMPWRWR
jgi:hypothetical protein